MKEGPGFERLLTDLSTRLSGVAFAQVPAEVERAMESVVHVLGSDRATLVEWTADGTGFVVTHSWARPGVPTLPHGYPTGTEAPWYTGRLRAGETLVFERLPDELPPEAKSERDVVERFSFRSHVAIPLSVGGRWVCAMTSATTHEYRSWHPGTVARLRIVGQILANAVHRARLESELNDALGAMHEMQRQLRAENEYLREEAATAAGFEELVGRSEPFRRVIAQAAQVAETPISVMLLGETGTGKELLARAIHAHSSRREQTFVKVNCAAFPPSLVESELFGHEKGAFTGAISGKPGRFDIADGGTLFLDEVGELPAEVQAKLLRVLQDGEFERLGSVRTRKVDVRIVAATNRDLPRAIADGRFREDLYYRLAGFLIHVPPLRERREDIPLLVWHHIHRRQAELGRKIERVPERVMRVLTSYAWPGNVRELGNVIDRALVLSKSSVLSVDESFAGAAPQPPRADDLTVVERQHVVHVLERCGWKINGAGNAAEILGLHPNTLRSRLRKLKVQRPARPVRGDTATR